MATAKSMARTRTGTLYRRRPFFGIATPSLEGTVMGRGILLWLLGVPIPVIILILLFWH